MKQPKNRRNSFSPLDNLTRKTLNALVAGAVLLFVVPFAVAQPVSTTLTHNANPVDAGKWFTGVSSYSGGATLTGVSSGTFAGVATDDGAATSLFNLETISVSGSAPDGGTDTLYGFLYLHDNVFSGKILGGANVKVVANPTGEVVGVHFRKTDGNGKATIGSSAVINFGNITATTTSGAKWSGAVGFAAGTVENGAKITLGNVTAASGWMAAGIEFTGNFEGTLSAKNINVTGGNPTVPIDIDFGASYGVNLKGTNNTGKVTIGKIDVTSGQEAAFGLFSAGTAKLVLDGDVSVNGSNNGDTSGIWTQGNADITLNNDVAFTTIHNMGAAWQGADIRTDGDLNIHLGGKTLTTNTVKVLQNLNVDGKGTAYLGVANVSGNTIIGNGNSATTVVLDHESILNGDNVLKKNATLVLGDTVETDPFVNLGEWTVDSQATLNGGIFTDWYVNADDFLQAKRATAAHVSDGYLAAFTMHNRFAAWYAVRDRMIAGSGYTPRDARVRHGYRGQAPCNCNACSSVDDRPCDPVLNDPHGCNPCDPIAAGPCDPCGSYVETVQSYTIVRNAWVNYIGRWDDYRSSYNGRNWELATNGVQGGTDLFRTRRGQIGFVFGYEKGKTTNDTDRVNMDDVYLGVYATRVLFNGADIRGVFAYGWQDYDMDRYSTWGNGLYTSSFKGHSMEANLELGKRLSSGVWSLRPVVAADVYSNKLKEAAETGAEVEKLFYHGIDRTQVFLRTGTELRCKVHHFTFNSGAYYAYDLNGKELNSHVTSLANPVFNAPLRGSKLGRELLTFNLGGEYWLAQCLSIFGGYQGEYGIDRENSQVHSIAYFGAGCKW